MSEPRKKSKKSKEEIAKEFDLPERKSKIATILKQDGQAYCICRSSDSSRFMIGCDACEEWYHGDCINVTEKEAKHIKHYYCQRCKEEDPTLQTVFRLVPVQGPTPNPEEKKPPKKTKEKGASSKSDKRCGQCEGCKAQSCGSCDACLGQHESGRKQRCEMRVCTNTVSRKKDREAKSAARPKKRKRSLTPEILLNPALEGDRQCYGPGCIMTARPQSKYCSDTCGMKLATSRIYQRCTLDPDALDNTDAEDEMFHVLASPAGHEIHSKTAIRHMEKCFNNKTYCKRLRVLCPEHSKDPKVNDTDVCGCPLVRNVFQLTGEFCRAPKKSCFKHYVWEKIRRAEIDLERVRQWIKMDELVDQERQVRQAMASRAGVLGLMLHSTYNHEIMEKLCSGKLQ
ncbi:CpG-binding protein [Culex quinquefasciatus]|uniref:CXXC-type zinc finger protein 1 n=1 Tax=Culex quinquefasciatus TaxID=7176 RepID=B0WFY0_CULQU|nr:CpG-binding protein [Culex quinquefasciatus]|eukprot:XP_001847614.1 CpG-binding protein [Culex quinquefasciatus]